MKRKSYKRCSKCKKSLPITKFRTRKSRAHPPDPNGVIVTICHSCESAGARQRKKINPMTYYLSEIRRRCKKTEMECNISLNEIIIPTYCPVLGLEIEFCDCKDRRNCLHDSRPTIDRIDNSKGYIIGNCKVISWRANRLKGDGTAEEHERIADFIEGAIK